MILMMKVSVNILTHKILVGFCAEGCSSALFPRIMGPSRANEMLVSIYENFGESQSDLF